jgi:citrate lyase subunit beta/citryl-CoA lyase
VLRSFLFAPATSDRKMTKALQSAADAVIIDLEDAVATHEKVAARRKVVEILKSPRPRPVYVRINALTTPFCYDELNEVGAAAPDGILLPKVEAESDVKIADWILSQVEARTGCAPGGIDLVPLIETAKGIDGAREIAKATSRVRRLAFGAVDLALDMDVELTDEAGAIAHARFAIAIASRIAGLDGPIDTAFVNIDALDRLKTSTLNARGMGYRGKCCIHPAQIDVVNAVFTPSEEELAQARRIVAAFDTAERSGAAAVSMDGLMIDYPVADKARRLLATMTDKSGAQGR